MGMYRVAWPRQIRAQPYTQHICCCGHPITAKIDCRFIRQSASSALMEQLNNKAEGRKVAKKAGIRNIPIVIGVA
jgi:hypothetical protein